MFLRPVTEFGFSAGELFLLVDEKKIKRRFISSIHVSLGVRAGPVGLLCGQSRKEPRWLMCSSFLPESIPSRNLSVVRIFVRTGTVIGMSYRLNGNVPFWESLLFYFPDSGEGRNYLT